MASKPTFYYMSASPPCRTVITVAKMLNVDMDLKVVDLFAKDHLKPEYLKLNPFHQVPTFVGADGFILTESRAIATYLIQKHKPDSELYPSSDLKRRAQIDRWLQFDLGHFGSTFRPVYMARFHGRTENDDDLKKCHDLLKTLDEVIGASSHKFLAGDHMSVADISMYSSSNAIEVFEKDFEMSKYPNFKAWYDRVGSEVKAYDKDGMYEKVIEKMKTLAH